MPTITPHLWYDTQAKEAARFYVGLFENSRILRATTLEDTPSGDAETVGFTLAGQRFSAISAGPYFRFNPSVSLMVYCDSADEVDRLWKSFSAGGEEMMPLGEYPFGKRYGWVRDRFGLSWQLMFREGARAGSKIQPNLLFSDGVCGKAEEAARFYADVFGGADSGVGFVNRYGEGEARSPLAKVNYAAFRLAGADFSAMDNAYPEEYTFNEAFSLMVNCDNQAEIDRFWSRLSAVPEAEQCGWLKDRYGFSWQIVPVRLNEMLGTGTKEQVRRVTEAFLKMKKFDIAELERAFGRLGQ
jgi:predicted 3-demethylubiquinone-9 3-methyltransferase (glyoxalase superfamily)